ncbi:MAG TPA: hypothetical protein VM784_09375, partial [Actinomycetota bacterium]|nr:hypothetical protein [Actinomycetota bacterium]HVM35542.1 hypothetical protein [Actinomycetota bacterium]
MAEVRWRLDGARADEGRTLGSCPRRFHGQEQRPEGDGDHQPAHPERIAPLLMSVYGVIGREQEVT